MSENSFNAISTARRLSARIGILKETASRTNLLRMKPELLRQLMLAKFLFQRAEKEANSGHQFSPGLCVSLLQDAAEIAAVAACIEVGVAVPKNMSFDHPWSNPDLKLLEKTAMMRLNVARVAFKHHGIVPSREAAVGFVGPTLRFLEGVCRDTFKVDFATVSLVDLIADPPSRKHLKGAELALADGKVEEALLEASRSLHAAGQLVARLVPRLDDMEPRGPQRDGRWFALSQHFNALRDFSIASALGVSLSDLYRSRGLLPSLLKSPYTGAEQVIIMPHQGVTPSLEDAEFAVRFVTDYVLNLENAIGASAEMKSGSVIGDL